MQPKPYVIKPVATGRYSDCKYRDVTEILNKNKYLFAVLETIPEDETLENIIDEEDLAGIKRELALKGIISDCDSVLTKSISDNEIEEENDDVNKVIEKKTEDKVIDAKSYSNKPNEEHPPPKKDETANKGDLAKTLKRPTESNFVYPNTTESHVRFLIYRRI